MLLISRFTFFCDIRACYLFLDSRFFATYGNVNLHCCEFASLAAVVFLTFCLDASLFRFPVGGGGAPLNGSAGQRRVARTGAPSEPPAAAAGEGPGPLLAMGSDPMPNTLCQQICRTVANLEKETCRPNVSVCCPTHHLFQNQVFENRVPRRLEYMYVLLLS